ncbi:RNA polymerase sigma factor [Blautia producta]|uniref:RNA polymerase sigma factor n=1 Tax=Blautia producta TaxID=33035 RepID=UPI0035BE3383
MKPSDFQKTVQCRFESCLKKVVRHVVKDYQQGLKRRKEKEISFCDLPEIVVEKLAVWDDYETDYTIFNVCGSDIRVYDDELAEALKKLSERNCENLLMYYFLDMSDTEIAKKQNIFRSGVFQNRHNSLALMKKLLKEK